MKIFLKGTTYILKDRDGVQTNCHTIREVMHILHKAYEFPLNQIELGLMDLLNNEYDVAEFGDVNGQYLFSRKLG